MPSTATANTFRKAKELGLIEGIAIGFDFHFKEFYGRHSEEKQIGKGPDKSGDLVPGFRPHVAWDLATNAIINIAYYQGGIRSPRIIRGFCEQNIFTVLDPSAIKEIYMDSEYTKEGDLDYFKQVKCKNGDVFICLKKNRQIKKLIEPALNESRGWKHHDTHDERKSIQVVLPNTKLPLTIVVLRDRETKDHIRCFGSTNTSLPSQDILKKYRYGWIIENGLKDLVYSYFADEIFGTDPEKIEFEFYCIMVARLAYEYFLKELGGEFLNKPDGNKCILSTMRNLLFERRNCTIEQDSSGNILLTFLDAGETALETRLLTLFSKLTKHERNKVLWWKNRGIVPQFRNQYNQDAPASV